MTDGPQARVRTFGSESSVDEICDDADTYWLERTGRQKGGGVLVPGDNLTAGAWRVFETEDKDAGEDFQVEIDSGTFVAGTPVPLYFLNAGQRYIGIELTGVTGDIVALKASVS